MKKKMIFAIDFDGTLCKNEFPAIGKQNTNHKILMEMLIDFRENGHKLILWTNRGDNEEYKSLSEAIEWCRIQGLEFDAVNENLPEQVKLSGYSPKIMADYYIDDKAIPFDQPHQFASLCYLDDIKYGKV